MRTRTHPPRELMGAGNGGDESTATGLMRVRVHPIEVTGGCGGDEAPAAGSGGMIGNGRIEE